MSGPERDRLPEMVQYVSDAASMKLQVGTEQEGELRMALMRWAVAEIKRLREFEWMYKDLSK